MDCSAAGTAIDQAIARSVASAQTVNTLKNLAGNAGNLALQLQPNVPISAPDVLTVPTIVASRNQPIGRYTPRLTPAPSMMNGNRAMPMGPSAQMMQGGVQHHNHHPAVAMQHQQQMQMQAQMQMQMQMQAQMQMQMQAQMHAAAISNQMQQQKSDVEVAVDSGVKVEGDVKIQPESMEESWHKDLEEEWKRAAAEQGHEGLTEGASIDELAQAWADAENLWADEVTDSAAIPSYEFKQESGNINSADAMAEGMRLFEAGETNRAILCFEAEVRSRPDNADAWRMTGRCHAENDEERKAISCLERAIEHDPYSLEALLALGVSYVNELNNEQALANLKTWVQHNAKYTELEIQDDGYGDGTVLDDVQNLMLQALQINPNDADVLEALGVCYNASRDYDSAVESFRAAIDARPNDYQLWNKLGATLANSSRSEEALTAYNKALDLKPKYARAWLNMAISHSNLHNYDDAARCYLQTLSLNPDAVHAWSYLRIALTCLEQWDLLPLSNAQDLPSFHEHFDFI